MPATTLQIPKDALATVQSSLFEAACAEELEACSYALRHSPKPNGAHMYTVRDPRTCRPQQPSLLTRHNTHKAGRLQISNVTDYVGTAIAIIEPGSEYHCFSLVHAGAMALSFPGNDCYAVGNRAHGTIHRGEIGLQALTSDGTSRTNLWVASELFDTALASAAGEPPRHPLVFAPTLDWQTAAAESVRRLILLAAEEFKQVDGIGSNPVALTGFTDMLVHTVLQRLPHNHSSLLQRGSGAAMPMYVKRAEDFIRARALEPLTMEQIAGAAGCSVRTLQLTYRRFRAITPYTALKEARLDRARHDLATTDESVAVLARRCGFTNASRFAANYHKRFGELPAALRRRQNS